jgi:hypothetical protein
VQHLQDDEKVGRVKRNGEHTKMRNQRGRRRKSHRRSFWSSLGRLDSDDEEESDIIEIRETRRRFDVDDEKQKIQYVVRGNDEIGTVDEIEERRNTGISDSKYQDHSNLVKLLNRLRKENKVSISII